MKRITFIAAMASFLAAIQCVAWAQYPGPMDGSMQGGPMQGGPMQGPMPGGPYPGGPGMEQGGGPGGMPPGMPCAQGEQGGPGGGDPAGMGACCQNCTPTWDFYADALFLSPRNNALPYGVVFNGPANLPPPGAVIQVAPPGELLGTYTTGVRGGFRVALDECNSIGASYLHYENDVYDSISTNIFQIRSLVSQPSTWVANSVSDWTAADAQQHVMLDVAEVDYKWMMFNDSCTTISLVTAGRYGSLKQRFGVAFTGNGEEDVNTDLQFEGGGMRVGLEGTEAAKLGFSFYGKGSFSCLAGSFRSTYVQSEVFAGNVVDTGYRDERLVPIVDLEGGVSWTSPGDHVRISVGFMLSSWFNVVNTNDVIQAVQQNNFNVSSSTMTFDGMTSSVELRF